LTQTAPPPLHLWLLPAVTVVLVQPASANCNAVIDAAEKAQKQERLAQYEVASRNDAPQGQPMLVRIGRSEYTSYSVGGRFSHYERHDSAGNPILGALKRSSPGRCESADDTYRGTAALKVRFDNPAAPQWMNPNTVWIDKRSGLPVYHEINGVDGGFAWVYGDTVKEPPVRK
jgi:hypothetical protein